MDAKEEFSFNHVIQELREDICDGLSPVTCLAKNLSGLSTTLPSTPRRRISWSNPTPMSSIRLTDSPMSIDSPMFQEGVLRGLKGNRISFEASQESGYSASESSASQDSVPSVRSSVFADEEFEDDGFFAVDKFIDEDENDSFSNGMSKLITQPLSDDISEHFSSKSVSCDKRRQVGKIRKCLSLTTECFSRTIDFANNSSIFQKCLAYYNEDNDDKENKAVELNESLKEKTATFVNRKSVFKRPNVQEPINPNSPLYSKRRKSSPSVDILKTFTDSGKKILQRCKSETTATIIMRAVQKSDQHPDLIGDCSKPYVLPLISGRHQDLKSISVDTLVRLIQGEFHDFVRTYTIIDCRYPYEYEAGHIQGAHNIYTKDDIYETLLSDAHLSENNEGHDVIVFHCEFSSERAPKLLRFLRNKDREINEDSYPRLHHPEIYILDGGYKAFYENRKELCDPQMYKPMLHKDHIQELREFRAKSKSCAGESKTRPKVRANLKF